MIESVETRHARKEWTFCWPSLTSGIKTTESVLRPPVRLDAVAGDPARTGDLSHKAKPCFRINSLRKWCCSSCCRMALAIRLTVGCVWLGKSRNRFDPTGCCCEKVRSARRQEEIKKTVMAKRKKALKKPLRLNEYDIRRDEELNSNKFRHLPPVLVRDYCLDGVLTMIIST